MNISRMPWQPSYRQTHFNHRHTSNPYKWTPNSGAHVQKNKFKFIKTVANQSNVDSTVYNHVSLSSSLLTQPATLSAPASSSSSSVTSETKISQSVVASSALSSGVEGQDKPCTSQFKFVRKSQNPSNTHVQKVARHTLYKYIRKRVECLNEPSAMHRCSPSSLPRRSLFHKSKYKITRVRSSHVTSNHIRASDRTTSVIRNKYKYRRHLKTTTPTKALSTGVDGRKIYHSRFKYSRVDKARCQTSPKCARDKHKFKYTCPGDFFRHFERRRLGSECSRRSSIGTALTSSATYR